MENLYHAQVYMPEIARRVSFAAMVRPTPHARAAATGDRYGAFTLPTVVDTRKGDIVEAKVVNGVVAKVVIRQEYNADHDIVLVLDPRPSMPVLITAWLNEKGDAHSTLDTSKYSTN
jgi:hypothetical protein